jgi:hypothetical protein
MTDEIFWDAHEELLVKLDREPAYEEVVDLLNSRFKENRHGSSTRIPERL